VGWLRLFFRDVVDECSTVCDLTCVWADPYLEDATFSRSVDADHGVADEIVVSIDGDEVASLVSVIVGGERQETESVAVHVAGVFADEADSVPEVRGKVARLDDVDGVRHRADRFALFWGDCVAADLAEVRDGGNFRTAAPEGVLLRIWAAAGGRCARGLAPVPRRC